ncbi:MAG: hypothetical protein A3A97_03090 [Candidatus Terrybacteria bacterium RIFCSPLOWO2_01_FULL_40_23]|uniref:PsbP C-terminal domain-containing protein n=1 Tax=Candidatus Terrybacteria bacterium RIFCSPLOWO2_01_FULL_40_23 TaxID=1802366 RepID=A0A1G2PQF4_9BACT|nr:MAG: hypothetical protein A3A97_03090 [Candidatus Terrybacteria bacterium RIFCSPLOWO2_01_FULL_40_23]
MLLSKTQIAMMVGSIAVTALVGGGAGFLYKQLPSIRSNFLNNNEQQNNVEVIDAHDEGQEETEVNLPDISVSYVSNWEIYQNTQYGFEINYPKEWFLEEQTIEDSEIFGVSISSQQVLEDSNQEKYFIVSIMPNVFTEQDLAMNGEAAGYKFQSIDFLGLPSNKLIVTGENELGKPSTSILFNRNSKGWLISHNNYDMTGNHNPVYDEIFSTFKFID